MKLAILLLAAVLGSASPSFGISVRELESCPAGYKNISETFVPKCVQVNCSAEDHKAQCDAKQDAKPAASAC
ncbi:hypothetical protein G3M48_005726 [Beauveria asiatica]|uniref:Uncharacterized protein n=1 Tax=Beauveria asiatica TaxID=1069075 RepID=A0AAW0RR25_9HYPO